MTKQIYNRLVLYRDPRKIDHADDLLSNTGYLISDAGSPPLYSLSPKAQLEMADFEEEIRNNARQSRFNWAMVIIGTLTLIAAIIGIVASCHGM